MLSVQAMKDTPSIPLESDREKKASQYVEAANALAQSLNRDCKKYPQCGKTMFYLDKSQYLVVQPADADGDSAETWGGCWER